MLDNVYLNGEYIKREEARLHVSDLSILRGYGVFDYFRYTGGQPRFLDDHVARFRASAAALGLDVGLAAGEIAEVVDQLIARNGGGEGGIRLVLTGGYAADGYHPVTPNLLGLPYAFTAPPAHLYGTGCTLMLHRYERQLPEVKSIDYLEGIRIQPALRSAGAQYPLYVDREDNVRESDRSNFLIVREGTIVTPRDHILAGVTRRHLLRLARGLGIPVREEAISTEALRLAREVIICSSVKGAMPVARIVWPSSAEAAWSYPAPGPVTRRLMEAWEEL